MCRGRRPRPSFGWLLLLFPLLARCGETSPAPDDRPTDAAPAFRLVFRDDTTTDRRADYAVSGAVNWSDGLCLGANSFAQRNLDVDCHVVARLTFDWPRHRDTPFRLRLHIPTENAKASYVEWSQEQDEDGEWKARVRISVFSTADNLFGSLFGTTQAYALRTGEIELGKLIEDDSCTWNISYRRGLLSVAPESRAALVAFIDNQNERVTSLRLESLTPDTRITEFAVRARPARRRVTAAEQRELAESAELNLQVVRLWQAGKPADALPLAQRALEIRQRIRGRYSYEVGLSQTNLAAQYTSLGDFTTARSLLKDALSIQEELVGRQHPASMSCLTKLATISSDVGDLAHARQTFQEVIDTAQVTRGPGHTDVATALTGLALVYQELGDYEQAITLNRRALEIERTNNGNEHPRFVNNLNNLAAMYGDLGDYDRAEPLFMQAADIRRRVLGEKHPAYATSLHNLAWLYSHKKDYDRAEDFYQRALVIRQEVLNEDHPEFASNLISLGWVFAARGDLDQAEVFYRRGLEISQRVLGESSPDYAGCLAHLADVCHRRGEFAKAAEFLKRSREIRHAVHGPDHLNYARSLRSQALLDRDTGHTAKAAQGASRAVAIVRDHLDRTALVQSQRQQKRAQSESRHHLDTLLSAPIRGSLDAAEVIEKIWHWKGAVTLRQHAYRQLGEDPRVASMFGELRSVTHQLSLLLQRVPAQAPPSANTAERSRWRRARVEWEERFTRLTHQREGLEEAIARSSAEFRRVRQPPTVAQVQALLPERTVVVDFLEYRPSVDRRLAGPERVPRHYLASIVRAGHDPVIVELGRSDELTALINDFRLQFSTRSRKREHLERSRRAGLELRERLWMPVERHLGGVATVIISPDTTLGTLPFAALPGRADDRYLLEDYRLASIPMLSLLPQLFESAPQSVSEPGLLVVGDVDYDSAPGSSSTESSTTLLAGLRGLRSGSNRHWASLAGFRQELESVVSLYRRKHGEQAPALILTRSQATEQAFLKHAGRFRTLHLITHGYFEDADVASIAQAAADASDESPNARSAAPFVNSWSPDLLSGLVMAGANAHSDPDDPHDGILRAAEIETARLSNVDLVVLSACETGLGATAGGEGLTGLQRAFQIAGARTCVATLWQVDDDATQQLMRLFYENLWTHGQSRIDALRNAQISLLNHPVLPTGRRLRGDPIRRPVAAIETENDASDRRAAPEYWAGFVLSGDWR